MDSLSERIKCIMDAIEHGFSVEETLEECPNCAPDLSVAPEGLRHENMGWSVPTTYSEGV
jgi:hypothetical protein